MEEGGSREDVVVHEPDVVGIGLGDEPAEGVFLTFSLIVDAAAWDDGSNQSGRGGLNNLCFQSIQLV